MSVRQSSFRPSSLSRRRFLKGMGLAGAAVSTAQLSSAPAQAQAQQPLNRAELVTELAAEHFRIRRQPIQWPNNARIAVFWVVDFEVFSDNSTSYDIAYHDYSGKAGFWRLLDLAEENGVKFGWYTNAIIATRYPETLREAARLGHEIDGHGWSNNTSLITVSAEVEREIIRRVFADIEKAAGVRPTGWLGSGWNTSNRTLEYLAEEGILWNGDYPIDDLPYTVPVKGKKIVIIPYVRESNDIQTYGPHRHSPQVWLDNFKEQFDVLYDEGEKYPQMVSAAMHSWLLGHPVGKRAIREAIRYTKGFPNVWQTTENEMAKWWLQQNYD